MDRIITLDGKDFLICQELDIDNNHYIYAISVDGEEYTVLLESEINGEKIVQSVSNAEEVKKVLSIIAQENI